MELSVAIDLLQGCIPSSERPQHWTDLGAGEGLFTRALGSLVRPGSHVVAVDQSTSALKSIAWDLRNVTLDRLAGNFSSLDFGKDFDGILMANSLHYVPNQLEFIRELASRLTPVGRIVIVEYERREPNTWVPYPIDFKKLKDIGAKTGFSIGRFGETPSVYGGATIYSAVLTR
ncbi:hypothetical protein WSM22_27780 [Cytophagales bacterium WSM2-2]|nr:hypothetical protein WSM22_27780 [Cytophagales bacterium WSM2-2]